MSIVRSTRSDGSLYGKELPNTWILLIIAWIIWTAFSSSSLSQTFTPGTRYLANIIFGLLLIISIITSILKINKQWEVAIILRLGKFDRTSDEGVFLLIPFIDKAYIRDTRTHTMDIPHQSAITKDNISVEVDAVMWYRISDVQKLSLIHI